MIVAEQKPMEEILHSLQGFERVLIASCGTCVTVCMAGGEKEAREMSALMALQHEAKDAKPLSVSVAAPKPQCDREFLEEIADQISQAQAILSLACGAGVQYMAELFPDKIVLPGLNTKFMGVTRGVGLWTEMCQGCGSCVLDRTGGVCPVTRCSKSNFNGPCGGSADGKCEIDPGTDCGWQLIYDRLKGQDRMELLYETIEVRDWTTSRDGGPRKVEKKDGLL